VQLAGRPSWRFGESDGCNLDLALFARDAAGLEVPPAPDIPPPLSIAIGDRLAPASAAAAAQWVTWWRGLVRFQTGGAVPTLGLGPENDLDVWLEAMRERHLAAFDPPEFVSLAAMPELRAVASATFAADGRPLMPRQLPDRRPPGAFDYDVVRAAAEDAIAEFGVDPDEIDGRVQILDVQGAWSHLAAPGYALCSAQLAADPAAAAALLRTVFASRLGREGPRERQPPPS
jgi:hypothetical protein